MKHSVGPRGPPFVAMSMGYLSSGLETSQVTDPHAAARPQPMVITAAGPQSMPSAWSGSPPSPLMQETIPRQVIAAKKGLDWTCKWKPTLTETRPSGMPQPPMFHLSGIANSPLLSGGNSNIWDVRSQPPPMSGTASMWPQQMGLPSSSNVWEHRPPLHETSGVPTPVSSQRMPSPSWSFTAPTPVPLPDAPWITSVPIRPHFGPQQGMATTLLLPQHLPVQQRPPLPFAAGSGGGSSYSGWKGPGLPGPHPPLGGPFPGAEESGRKSFDPFLQRTNEFHNYQSKETSTHEEREREREKERRSV
ncbi:unnamed protein product [Sphagnum tenellum]